MTSQKHAFSLPEDLHYLNCAYMAPLSRKVEEAGIAGVRRKRNPTGITAADFFEEAARVKELFSKLVNAGDPGRIAIVPAVSYGLAVAAKNTPMRRGQNIVVAHEQFPSNVHVWRAAARRGGLQLRTVAPPDGPGRGAAWNERLLDAIDADTALVALGHVHWTDGTRFDLDAIGERARAVGAALVVDGTQSVGALPMDVRRVQPDALVCAGYKWLLGPYSVTLAYFGPRYDQGEPLEETWIGRAGSEDFRGLVNYTDEYRTGAARYDAGESGNFVLLPMLIAALEHLLDWGVDEIQAYCRDLIGPLIAAAEPLGYRVEDERWRSNHLVGLRAPDGIDLADLNRRMSERNVVASLRGSALRISPHVYNEPADIDALVEVLRG